MKKILSIIFVVSLLSMNVYAAGEFNFFKVEKQEITLEKATEYMLTESTGAKVAKINKDKAANYVQSSEETIDALDKLSNAYGLFIADYDSQNIVLAKINRDYGKKQSEDNYQAELNKLKYDLRLKYFTLLQVQDVYNIKKASLDIATKSFEEMSKRYELGLINKLDLNSAMEGKEQAEGSLLDAEKNLTLAKMDLNNFLGYDLDTNLVPTDSLEKLELPKKSVSDTVTLALENNNSLKGLKYAAQIQGSIVKGIGLRYSSSSLKYSEAIVAQEDIENNMEMAKNGLEISVYKNYMEVLINNYNSNTAKSSVDYASEQLKAAQLSYDLGLSTYLDVQKAQANLESKEIALSKAVLDYNLAVDKYNLVGTVGTETAPIVGSN